MKDLLKCSKIRSMDATLQNIKDVVWANDKQRFELICLNDGESDNPADYKIWAAQGHTMKVIKDEELLTLIEFPWNFDTVVHGTYKDAWNIIKDKGLNRMAWNHIHFAIGYSMKDGVISGMRSSCDIFIEINLAKAMADGYMFYISSNGVILCPGDEKGTLPPTYFSWVISRSTGQIIFEQIYDNIIVYDFEAICREDGKEKYEV